MMNYRNELKELIVYGMIEGEQTFMEALADAANYLELANVSFDGRFQADCVAEVNAFFAKEGN